MIVGVHDTLKIFTKSWCWTRDDYLWGSSCVYAIFFAFKYGPLEVPVIQGLYTNNNNMGNPERRFFFRPYPEKKCDCDID